MSVAAVPSRPEVVAGAELKLRCLDLAGVVECDGAGRPVAFRRRCRNRRCCPPRDGHMAVHRWFLVGRRRGQFETEYVPDRPLGEALNGRDVPR